MASTIAQDRNDFDLPIFLGGSRQAILRMPVPMSSAEFATLMAKLTASLEGLRSALVQDPEKSDDGIADNGPETGS